MIGTILMFIFQVPYKKLNKKNIPNIYHINIYICYDIFFAGGEHMFFYICYNLFSVGGEHIFYRGSTRAHKVSSSKRGRILELALMIHLWSHFNGALLHKPIQKFYMIKTFQRELLLMCIVMVNSMLKALKHTHIIALLVDLYMV